MSHGGKSVARLPDWQARLVAYLGRIQSTPFDAATHHCALFAAGAVEAMTGRDLAAPWRGLTLTQGMAALRQAGFADHVDLVASHLDEVPVAFAQPGDVAALSTPDGLALGIVQGAAIYILRPEGLGLSPLLSASRMFRVQ